MPTGDISHFINTNDPQSARDYSNVREIVRVKDNGDNTLTVFRSDDTEYTVTGIAIVDYMTRINAVWG